MTIEELIQALRYYPKNAKIVINSGNKATCHDVLYIDFTLGGKNGDGGKDKVNLTISIPKKRHSV